MIRLEIDGNSIEFNSHNEKDLAWAKMMFECNVDMQPSNKERASYMELFGAGTTLTVELDPKIGKVSTDTVIMDDLPGPSFDFIPTEDEIDRNMKSGYIVGSHFVYNDKTYEVISVQDYEGGQKIIGKEFSISEAGILTYDHKQTNKVTVYTYSGDPISLFETPQNG